MLETAEPGDVGTRVRVAGGRIHGAEDCARQSGTTVIVRNLFFNVPARAKFLKGAGVETRAVAEVVTVLALSNLSIAFRLDSNGRALLDLPPATDLVSRTAALWGDDAARRMVAVTHGRDGIRIAGLVERPDAALAGPRRVHLFVGGRPFRDRDLVFAAERGYRTTVPHGARPSLLLYVDVPGGSVDVNVHPSKAEVRFENKSVIEAIVEDAIRNALATPESSATLDRKPAMPLMRQVSAPAAPAQLEPATDAGTARFLRTGARARRATGRTAAGSRHCGRAAAGAEAVPGPRHVHPRRDAQRLAHHRPAFRARTHPVRTADARLQRRGSGEPAFAVSSHDPPLSGGVRHRRIRPANCSREPGFEIEPFGARTVIVHGAPAPHPYFNAERCLRDMLAELATGSELTRAAKNQHERIAMMFACKGAIKAGQKLVRA